MGRDLQKFNRSLKSTARSNPGAGLSIAPNDTGILEYTRHIIKEFSNPFWGDVQALLLPELQRLEPQYISNSSAVDRMRQVIGQLRNTWGDIGPDAQNLATRWANENSEFHRKQFLRSLDGLGVNIASILTDRGLEEQLESAIEINVDLITSIPQKDLDRIEKVLWDGIRTGSNYHSLKSQIMDIYPMDRRRARTIARDQTSKLNGNLNRIRQLDVGIIHYFWRCTGDGPPRVRKTHWANNNKKFRWDSPPPKTGHPGHDVNCRCYSDPDLTPLLNR